MLSFSPTESDILAALRTWLIQVLPDGSEAVLGQENQVGEPKAKSFVVMWPIMRPRLATNVDTAVDTSFTASISGTTMTVTDVAQGELTAGAVVFGVGVAANTKIVSGPGGVGAYVVDTAQTVGSEAMACGHLELEQETEYVVQIDVHAATVQAAGDMAGIIATTFRDEYAYQIINGENSAVAPLYAEDPRQSPFLNAEQQYESRWTIDVHLQANQTVTGIPQQFAAALAIELVNVDAAYPP